MNLYLKYGPLVYTWNTRIINKSRQDYSLKDIIFSIFGYLFSSVGIGLIFIIFSYIHNDIMFNQFIKYTIFYSFLFIIFSIFYEIGYILNDYVTKYEKKPTYYVDIPITKKYVVIQVFIRMILGCFGVRCIWNISKNIGNIMIIIISIMLLVYFIHNIVRNYFYNYFTVFALRILKFSVIFPIIELITGDMFSIYTFFITSLFVIYYHYDLNYSYNKKLGGTNSLDMGQGGFGYLSMSSVLFYIISGNNLFLIYFLVFFFIFILLTSKQFLNVKNNR